MPIADQLAHAADADLASLAAGLPPIDGALLERLSVGIGFVTNFWREQYLKQYIALGGSKIKFVTGNSGSGKTHCLRLFLHHAAQDGFKTAQLSARATKLYDFKEIYTAILMYADLQDCIKKCAKAVVREMGYDAADIPEGGTFADYLSGTGRFDALTRREMREQLNLLFLKNPRIDNNFAICCGILTGDALGYPILEPQSRALLYGWLSGAKEVRMPAIRRLGLSPSRITKYNARHMLRSLIEVLKTAGYNGLVVGIDDLDALAELSVLDDVQYTKMHREDAYESIRELVDDIDTLSCAMFVFAGHRKLFDNESAGIKSYQALWMRIQNEIANEQFNRFSDMIDMDRLIRQVYTPKMLVEMSRRFAELIEERLGEGLGIVIEHARAEALKADMTFSGGSLPRKICLLTLGRDTGGSDRDDEADGGWYSGGAESGDRGGISSDIDGGIGDDGRGDDHGGF
ncbi:MAG: ATP-binding protein [Clostridiales bacterium]|jgi:hypothetical protein|nr:ATP-binding protein [Clostridiales bacterium]